MSAVVAYYYQSNWIFPLLIVIGGAPVKFPVVTGSFIAPGFQPSNL
jgi:hypothetical protein